MKSNHKLEKTIALLQRYNDWRRGTSESVEMPEPLEIGVAIDEAIKAMKTLAKMQKEQRPNK